MLIFNPLTFEQTANYLVPQAVATYLHTITKIGKDLLYQITFPKVSFQDNDELADLVHTLAGCAGMFGFECVSLIGRQLENAIQVKAEDIDTTVKLLSSAVENMLEEIKTRKLINVEK